MSSPAEVAARTYIAAAHEPDRAKRLALLEACFADDGRFLARGGEMRGRAAVAKSFDDFFADPRGFSARVTSAVDAGRTIFRFRSVAERRDGGPTVEFYDVGHVDADGRIALLITFAGPLADAES